MSLNLRIILTILIMGAAVTLLTTWQVLSRSLETGREQVAQGEKFLLDVLRGQAQGALITQEVFDLEPFLEFLGHDPAIRRVHLSDIDERVVASTDEELLGGPAPPRRDSADGYWRVREIEAGGNRIGLLAVEFSNAPMERLEAAAWRQGTLVVAVGLGISIILAGLGARLVTGRLRLLLGTADEMARGNNLMSASLPGKDEVAHLSQAFDALMARAEDFRLARENQVAGLALSERRLATLMDSLDDPVFFKDPQGTWQDANVAGRHLLRLDGVPWRGKDDEALARLVAPLARFFRSAHEADRETLATATPRRDRQSLQDPDGRERELELERLPVVDERGEVLGLLLVAHDLSARLEAERNQALVDARLDAAMRAVADAVVVTDAQGQVTAMNGSAERLTGWAADQAQGHALTEVLHLIHPHTRQSLAGALRKATLEGGPVGPGTPIALVRREGQETLIRARAVPVRDVAGQASGQLVAFHDATAGPIAQGAPAQVSRDALTGLLARRSFEDRLGEALQRPVAEDRQHVLALLDLDAFRQVNERLGHFAADELLRQVAILLAGRLRASDPLARLGGDELALLLEGCPVARAETLLDDLRKAVEAFRFAWQGNEVRVTLSVGAVPVPREGADPAELLRAVQAACFRAKEQGGNRVYTDPTWARQMARQYQEKRWLTRLEQGFDQGRFQLHYQPALALAAGRDPYREVLLRFLDENEKLVPARTFLPAAQHFGLTRDMDRWVLGELLARAPEAEGAAGGGVWAVNLSAESLLDPDLAAFLEQRLAASRLPAAALCIEVPEVVANREPEAAARLARELRRLGCRLALDNVGASAGAFTTLKALDVDFVKLDGALVRDAVADPLSLTLLEAAQRLAALKGAPSIATWVESAELLERLTAVGVDYVQGFAVEPPHPLAAAAG